MPLLRNVQSSATKVMEQWSKRHFWRLVLRSETFSDTLRGPLAFFFGQTEG